jgi:hypothetical protein
MNRITLLGVTAVSLALHRGAEQAATAVRAPVALARPLQGKKFFLLSMIERTVAARQAVETEPALAKMAA